MLLLRRFHVAWFRSNTILPQFKSQSSRKTFLEKGPSKEIFTHQNPTRDNACGRHKMTHPDFYATLTYRRNFYKSRTAAIQAILSQKKGVWKKNKQKIPPISWDEPWNVKRGDTRASISQILVACFRSNTILPQFKSQSSNKTCLKKGPSKNFKTSKSNWRQILWKT